MLLWRATSFSRFSLLSRAFSARSIQIKRLRLRLWESGEQGGRRIDSTIHPMENSPRARVVLNQPDCIETTHSTQHGSLHPIRGIKSLLWSNIRCCQPPMQDDESHLQFWREIATDGRPIHSSSNLGPCHISTHWSSKSILRLIGTAESLPHLSKDPLQLGVAWPVARAVF